LSVIISWCVKDNSFLNVRFNILQTGLTILFSTFSAITGFGVSILKPDNAKVACKFDMNTDITRHIIFSAETHNFPTGISYNQVYLN
jgi:hypothetical protein